LAAVEPLVTGRVVDEARRLDQILAGAPSAVPSPQLRDRIVRAAPAARAAAWRWVSGVGLGAGLAAACVAGVAAGLVVTPSTIAPTSHAADPDPTEEAAILLREPPDLAEMS